MTSTVVRNHYGEQVAASDERGDRYEAGYNSDNRIHTNQSASMADEHSDRLNVDGNIREQEADSRDTRPNLDSDSRGQTGRQQREGSNDDSKNVPEKDKADANDSNSEAKQK